MSGTMDAEYKVRVRINTPSIEPFKPLNSKGLTIQHFFFQRRWHILQLLVTKDNLQNRNTAQKGINNNNYEQPLLYKPVLCKIF